MQTVTDAILGEIARDAHDVEVSMRYNPDGTEQHRATAAHRITGERWIVNAPDAYSAAFELATVLGGEFP